LLADLNELKIQNRQLGNNLDQLQKEIQIKQTQIAEIKEGREAQKALQGQTLPLQGTFIQEHTMEKTL
jgi:hypothetical protein